jgi:hypothetical protein
VLKLHLREIGESLADDAQRVTTEPGVNERNGWLDSSLELTQGLEVTELSVDLLLFDLESPVTPPPTASHKRA